MSAVSGTDMGQDWSMRPADRVAVNGRSQLHHMVTIPLSREFFRDYLPLADRGDIHYGVAMCFLPIDISLRAHAIEAIFRVAEAQGVAVAGRRDVPMQPASTTTHVSQFVLIPDRSLPGTILEHHFDHVRVKIERELWSMGLMQEEARVISCSSRSVSYVAPDDMSDPVACYPDLTYALSSCNALDADQQASIQS